jgi:hypothetical protein
MSESHLAFALSLARIILTTRNQLASALREAAQLDARAAEDLSGESLALIVDDTIYAIGRDGADALEYHVRRAVEDIARAARDVGEQGN